MQGRRKLSSSSGSSISSTGASNKYREPLTQGSSVSGSSSFSRTRESRDPASPHGVHSVPTSTISKLREPRESTSIQGAQSKVRETRESISNHGATPTSSLPKPGLRGNPKSSTSPGSNFAQASSAIGLKKEQELSDAVSPMPKDIPTENNLLSSPSSSSVSSEITSPSPTPREVMEEKTPEKENNPPGKVTSPWFVNPEQPGYVGFANLPNQVHRKSVKKGFEFTLMVVGESGLGKSTLVNSLFLTDLYPERHIPSAQEKISQTVKIDASTVEIEERGVKLRLTVVDTPGFGDSLNSVDCFKPIIQYVDDQFERYLNDESGLNRRHIVDNRVHCCFYFINPSGHGMRPLDIAFMRALHHKVNIVPVIAKADTLTKQEVMNLKKKIMDQIDEYGISIYPLPDCDSDEDEDYREQCRQLKEAVPFAVVGCNTIIEVKGKKVRGRMYPWGVVEVENPEHCDFIKLRTMLITHMQDLQEVTQEVHYENFRAERLAVGGGGGARKASRPRRQDSDDREQQLQQKDAELRRMQEMLVKMQAEMEAQKVQQNGGIRSHNV